jgi:hypothetical protein
MLAVHTFTLVAPFARFGHSRARSQRIDDQGTAEVTGVAARAEDELKRRPTNLGWRNPDWWQDRHYERR